MYFSMEAPVFEINSTYYFLIIKEALVGIIIGFIAYLIMSAIQTAGGFIDFQMGFANGQCDGSANRCTESNHGTVFIYHKSFFLTVCQWPSFDIGWNLL